AGPAAAQGRGYYWEPFSDGDPSCVKLMLDGRQVGIYRFEGDAFRWLDRAAARFGPPSRPPLAPPVRRGLNFGLAEDKLGAGGRSRAGARDVPRDEALALSRRQATDDPRIPDRRGQLYLTAIGPERERRQVLDDVARHPAFAGLRERLIVNGYAADDWHV